MNKQVDIEGYLNASTPYISLDTRDSLKVIMTKETNPAMLAVLYAKGLCAHEDYMTLAEALAVTNELIDALLLNNNTVYSFNEFKYFTGVTFTGDGGFARNCGTLESITFPKSLTEIGYATFSIGFNEYLQGLRSKLHSVKNVENIERVGECAFQYAQLIKELNFSNKLTTLNPSAFIDANNLAFIGDTSNITTADGGSFYGTNISYIELPKITVLPNSMFYKGHIETLNINWENITSIELYAFTYTPIKEIGNMPLVTDLPLYCFGNCRSLEKVGDLSNVITVGKDAFVNTIIKDIELTSATTIGNESFADSDLSGEVYFPVANNIGQYAFAVEDKANIVRTIKFGLPYESITFSNKAFTGNTKTTIICNNVELTTQQYIAVGAIKPL